MLLTEIATLDRVLQAHAAELGGDYTGYRNHTYRVANFCLAQAHPAPDAIEKTAIAVAFHDLGIWTDGTFDYLPPSIRLAEGYLSQAGRMEWTSEVSAMILEHHKIRACRDPRPLIEAFRRADWIDVSKGILTFDLPRSLVTEVIATWPNAGFHARLVQLSLTRLATHPLSPLPMMRF